MQNRILVTLVKIYELVILDAINQHCKQNIKYSFYSVRSLPRGRAGVGHQHQPSRCGTLSKFITMTNFLFNYHGLVLSSNKHTFRTVVLFYPIAATWAQWYIHKGLQKLKSSEHRRRGSGDANFSKFLKNTIFGEKFDFLGQTVQKHNLLSNKIGMSWSWLDIFARSPDM